MKTLISETVSNSIDAPQSPQRAQESPDLALTYLSQASKIAERSVESPRSEAPDRSTAVGLATILAGGLAPSKFTWRSHTGSIAIHALIIALLFLIAVPVIEEVKQPVRIVLIAPQLNRYRPKLIHTPRIQPPRPILASARIARPILKVPPVKLQPIRPAPVIKPAPQVASVQPLPKIEALQPPPVPKPQIRTGIFEAADVAKAAQGAKQIKTGGFGDPHGVPPNSQSSSSLMMAQLGSFDLPNGEAKGGGGGKPGIIEGAFGSGAGGSSSGKGHSGSVRAGGFGDGSGTGTVAGNGSGHGGTVRNSGFGDSAAQPSSSVQRAAVAAPATTPTEILFKPKPVYTPEARALKIEGQVALEVVFQASGTVRIMRVVHGLGHGLDEAAEQAAQQMRFRPATRGGVAVDTTATLYVTFELI